MVQTFNRGREAYGTLFHEHAAISEAVELLRDPPPEWTIEDMATFSSLVLAKVLETFDR